MLDQVAFGVAIAVLLSIWKGLRTSMKMMDPDICRFLLAGALQTWDWEVLVIGVTLLKTLVKSCQNTAIFLIFHVEFMQVIVPSFTPLSTHTRLNITY